MPASLEEAGIREPWRDLTHDRPATPSPSPGSPHLSGPLGPGTRLARPGLAAGTALALSTPLRHGTGRTDQGAALSRRHPPPAFLGQGEAHHLAVHVRRTFAPGDARSQTEAGPDARQADARIDHERAADRAAARSETGVPGPAASLPEV